MTMAMVFGGSMSDDGMTGPMWMPTLPPTFARLFAIHPQPIPILPALGVLLLALYILGLLTLRRRGDEWPVGRTACWVAGVASVELMTATGFDGYGMELFSVHMVQHMTLGMLSPILFVLGAPITLLLRALSGTGRTRRRARSLLLTLVQSRPAAVLTHPVFACIVFLFSLYGLYFTPLFGMLMSTMWGHNVMLIHFCIVGFLYFWGVLGVDPSPRRRGSLGRFGSPVSRIAELAVPIPFHAFFGVVLMMAATLMAPYYAGPSALQHISALSDQQVAGGIAWGFTELPTLVVLAVLIAQWQKSEGRALRAAERRAMLDGDAVLVSYNDYLSALARRDATTGGRR